MVRPSPTNWVSVITEVSLTPYPPIELAAGADPRDIVFVGDTAIISQHGLPALARVDLTTRAITSIDLAPLADPNEGVAAGNLAVCGSRVFVQLQRATTPGIGVVDITPTGATILQTIPTAAPPAFVMPVDCDSTLYVAEPIPLMQGGGSRERIDLATLTAAPFPIGDGLGEVGGFAMTGADTGWFIHHTEFGPAPSSHLSLLPGHGGVWDTFADVQIDHLAYDAATNQVFFPDACTTDCGPSHATGLVVFAADTGAASSGALDVGFAPIDVVVAR